ncbi:MAG: intradiol ring-cleavage dioxygenase [Candidatus Rokuibacteriota bacterium]
MRTSWVLLRAALAALPLVATPAVTARAQPACAPTRPDAEGPFYEPNAPERDRTGRGLVVGGIVRSAAGCGPVAGARLEWWSADPRGRYDDAHRATHDADPQGRYRYETDFPGRYPGRPPHLHVRVTAPGHRALVTQLYPKPGQSALQQDFVLVRE